MTDLTTNPIYANIRSTKGDLDMNNYINKEVSIYNDETDTRAAQMLFIVLCFIFICIMVLLNVNLFAYLFDGIDRLNNVLDNLFNIIGQFFSFLSPSQMIDQINGLF